MYSETRAPSSSALCASMGPFTMSPIAKMLGMLVRKWSSTLTFRPSSSTPTASKPRLSMNWRRPTQTRTTSDSQSVALPPAAASVLTLHMPFPSFSTPVTLVFSLKFMPCFFRIARNCLATSPSMPTPPMASRNSTTVTSDPRRAHTEPNSRPMTPPPMTVSFSGTLSKVRAPVLETICFSSRSMPGRLTTSEPVASMMFFVSMTFSPPSLSATLTELGLARVPWPLT
mmetsp:Transcript_37497/g.84556  ORF Transcript_37497/g.84556 Transcript_37497/m.84556 type:complete len:228 (+) Transcript_37497:554-1237(+)